MRNAGITGPRNPVARRVANNDLIKMASTPGAMSSMASSPLLGPTEGRSRLNNLGANGRFNMDGMAKTMGRTAAAHGSDAQWALPKLHDPFEYWRERTWWFNM